MTVTRKSLAQAAKTRVILDRQLGEPTPTWIVALAREARL